MVNPQERSRAQTFGRVARDYDRFRPGYPAELFDALEPLAGKRVLESGAGTGKATLELLRRGAAVTAVEPDSAMSGVLQEAAEAAGLTGQLRIETATLEQVGIPPASFDLLTAAQSWHWVDPERGAAAARHALTPGGRLAVWWNRPREFAGPLWDAIQAVYARRVQGRALPDRATALQQVEKGVPPAKGFSPWTHRVFDWDTSYSTDQWLGLVATHSDHLALEPETLHGLLGELRDTIEAGGGRVAFPYSTLLLQAQPLG